MAGAAACESRSGPDREDQRYGTNDRKKTHLHVDPLACERRKACQEMSSVSSISQTFFLAGILPTVAQHRPAICSKKSQAAVSTRSGRIARSHWGGFGTAR
jgi:hypothetical protein